MFVDEIQLTLKAGRGGDGVVRWRHEKSKEFSGASGGNAGRGGSVYAKAVRNIHGLARFRNQKEFSAGRGGDGMGGSKHGKDGEDLVLEVPVGTRITELPLKHVHELVEEGQTVLLLSGGTGGLGNEHFKGSKNTTPKQSTSGKEGGSGEFLIELLLVADVGLIGLPNAGKSSLLNALTRASAKVGDFPFTTLDPNLGEYFGYVLADIPGLIEGASAGKGLGFKFLRHVERTAMLLHLVSLEHEDPVAAWQGIRRELEAYGQGLGEKREIVVLTKTDLADEVAIAGVAEAFKRHGADVLAVSIVDDASVKAFGDRLVAILKTVSR
jgi:GTPase